MTGKRYNSFSEELKRVFGCRVHRISIDAGFTCPNRDGKLAVGGCAYCDGRGSTLRQKGPLPSVAEQIQSGKSLYRNLRGATKFIAYFQTFTNTYGPVGKLRALYDEALMQEDVIGISVGTRPDCVDEEILGLLQGYAKTKHVWIEYGLQSIHDRTLERIGPEARAAVPELVQLLKGKDSELYPGAVAALSAIGEGAEAEGEASSRIPIVAV